MLPQLAMLLGLTLLVSACSTPAAPPTPTATADMRPTATPAATGIVVPSRSASPTATAAPSATPSATPTVTVAPTITQTATSSITANWRLAGSGEFLLYGTSLKDSEGDRVYTIRAFYPGEGDHIVTYGDLAAGQPLSPDGKRVVFGDFEEWPLGGLPVQVFIANLETGSIEPLRLAEAWDEFYWSPDGRYLLYREPLPGNMWNARLALYEVSTHVITYLTSPAAIVWIAGWSPDGSQVAYVSDANGNFDLYTFSLETLENRQLTDDPALEVEVHWLPGRGALIYGPAAGDRIPVEPPWAVGTLHMFDLQADSRTLVGEGSFSVISVDPEGRRIAYEGPSQHTGQDLCMLDLETLEENCELLGERWSEFSSFWATAWSADGTKLAFRARVPDTLCAKSNILDLQTGELTGFDEGCYGGLTPPLWSLGSE